MTFDAATDPPSAVGALTVAAAITAAAQLGWSALVVVLALAVPAMATDHAHSAGESHDDGHAEVASGAPAFEAASHADGHGDAHEHATGEAATSDATIGEASAGHDHAIPTSLDHDPTDEQLADAGVLIEETKAATAHYASLDAALADGYVSIGDGRSGYEHFVHLERTRNDTILDPSEPESLVYRVLPDGGRQFTTVMYLLPVGSTTDDIPDVAGNLTVWHGHDDLCIRDGSVALAGATTNGECPQGSTAGTPPMLHVWVEPNECGPFAGTDANQMTGSCVDTSPA